MLDPYLRRLAPNIITVFDTKYLPMQHQHGYYPKENKKQRRTHRAGYRKTGKAKEKEFRKGVENVVLILR